MITSLLAVLLSAALALSPATGPGLNASYAYDAFGRRISKTVNGQTLRFLYDGDQLLEDRSATGAFLALYGYGSGIDEVLLRYTNTNQLQVYHHDHLGSVQFLLEFAGTPLEGTAYDAYGAPSSPSALGNRFLFTGREYDAETGLYYYRARYYSPTLGRFLSRDPLGNLPDLNLYRYVGNNPINLTDPTGQNPVLIIGLGALFGGAAAFLNTLAAQAQSGGFANPSQAFWNAAVAAGVGAMAGGGATAAILAAPNMFGVGLAGLFSGLGNAAYQSVSGQCGEETNLTSIALSTMVGAAGAGYGLGFGGSFAGGSVSQVFASKLAVAGGVTSPFGMLAAVAGTAHPVTFGQASAYLQTQLNNLQNFIQELWLVGQAL